MESKYFTNEKITDHYKIMKELGQGTYAIVKEGVNKKTGEHVAIKIIDKSMIDDQDEIDALMLEVEIMAQIDHPNIIKLYEIYDTKEVLYLVMELMQGGELFDRIVEQENYSEQEAAETILPIIDGIRYCHELKIIHRDLKPENILYKSNEENSEIKISDFGLARFVLNDLATTACGTPSYLAPEVIKGKAYGKEVDYWSIGIIIYVMLCGFPPFYNENHQQLFEEIKNGKFDFPSPYWDNISKEAIDLIKGLLKTDPTSRLSTDSIINHQWFKNHENKENLLPEVPNKIKQYNARRRLRKAGMLVLAATRWKKLLQKKE